jgi:Fe-S-cluster containining protein
MTEAYRDCSCSKCVRACKEVPGWFAPGEAERAAAHCGIPFEDFAKQFLIKDHASNPDVDNAPYVWTPRKSDDGTGDIRPHHRQGTPGTCVFLKNDRCEIHAFKPYECRIAIPCQPETIRFSTRDDIEDMYLQQGAPLGMDR